MSEQYRVRVTKDHLVFSAAHFITFNGNVCERLHGHNWRVAVEAAGALDENFYVVDFITLRLVEAMTSIAIFKQLQALAGELSENRVPDGMPPEKKSAP